MYTTIQKWGNSRAICLPRSILEKAGLEEIDQVELVVKDGSITIVPAKNHLTLREILQIITKLTNRQSGIRANQPVRSYGK